MEVSLGPAQDPVPRPGPGWSGAERARRPLAAALTRGRMGPRTGGGSQRWGRPVCALVQTLC